MMLFNLSQLLTLVTLLVPAATAPHSTDPTVTASTLIDAMIKRNGDAAQSLYATGKHYIDAERISKRLAEINAGRFENTRGIVVGSMSRGHFSIVEVEWDYKGYKAWDVLYLVNRAGRWQVFASDAPPVIDHMVSPAEREDFRGLVNDFEARRSQKLLGAVPAIEGAVNALEALDKLQTAINTADEVSIRKLCLQTTMRLIDGADQLVKEVRQEFHPKGDIIVEALTCSPNSGPGVMRVNRPVFGQEILDVGTTTQAA